jgi:hypothetical protein
MSPSSERERPRHTGKARGSSIELKLLLRTECIRRTIVFARRLEVLIDDRVGIRHPLAQCDIAVHTSSYLWLQCRRDMADFWAG